MRKLYLAGAGLVALAFSGSLAQAEPPRSMVYYEPKTPFIVCNSRDEIKQVLDAVRAHQLQQKLAEFAKTTGSKHEPACVFSDIGPVVFGASEHVGVLFDSEKAINMWVSHVGNHRGEFYILWGEVGKVTSV
jgi:hypothetical protein